MNHKSHIHLGDRAVVKIGESVMEGVITLISLRGINISTNWGDRFFKWTNVLKVWNGNEWVK